MYLNWIVATLYEAAIGSGDHQTIAQWEAKAQALPVAHWMQETRINQGEKLKKLLEEYQTKINVISIPT